LTGAGAVGIADREEVAIAGAAPGDANQSSDEDDVIPPGAAVVLVAPATEFRCLVGPERCRAVVEELDPAFEL